MDRTKRITTLPRILTFHVFSTLTDELQVFERKEAVSQFKNLTASPFSERSSITIKALSQSISPSWPWVLSRCVALKPNAILSIFTNQSSNHVTHWNQRQTLKTWSDPRAQEINISIYTSTNFKTCSQFKHGLFTRLRCSAKKGQTAMKNNPQFCLKN